ncbi:helix-turn-helix domain-containing protein [Nocardia acidivorans]|uniref:helix-turn-helix domain-containing protein n=1 Tax=Nocardia acidivorans TaxID=404580 RepID=UPI0012F7BDF8|nr:helix-turn-helix domain-containing protein [Nocardia acidivorans]
MNAGHTAPGGFMADQLLAPNLADFVRTHRTSPRPPDFPRGLSRPALAARCDVSASYIAQIEQREKVSPSPEVVDAIARALELTPAERQHMHNLAAPKTPGPRTHDPMPVTEMLTLITADLRDAANDLMPHLSGYVDERWNVLWVNETYDRAYPRLLEVVNILVWFFLVPESRRVMIEWEDEARLTVNWFRWHMGRYQDPEWAMELLAQLSSCDEFRAMYLAERVDFERHQPLMHLRDPDTHEPYSVRVRITDVPGVDAPFQWFIGIRQPFNGPASLLTE